MHSTTHVSLVILITLACCLSFIVLVMSMLKSKRISRLALRYLGWIASTVEKPATFIAAWIDRGIE